MKSTTKLTSSSEGSQPFTYDPEFTGPVKKRSCTDILCLFLFVSLLAGWVVVCFFAFEVEDVRILFHPTDSDGNICGVAPFESESHLYFFDFPKCANFKFLKKSCPTTQVCVSECPNSTYLVTPLSKYNTPEFKNSNKFICKAGVDRNREMKDLLDEELCASLYLKSVHLMGRCVPADLLSLGDDVLDSENKTMERDGKTVSLKSVKLASKILALFINARETGRMILSDLKISAYYIVLGLIFAMLISFMWIILMRWVSAIMVWISIILFFGLSAFGSYFCTMEYIEQRNKHRENQEFEDNVESSSLKRYTWLFLSIFCAIIFLTFFVILVFLRERIRIAIAIINEASRAVGQLFVTMAFPIIPYLLQLALFSLWCIVALYIAASGRSTYSIKGGKNDTQKVFCNPRTYNGTGECVFLDYGTSGNIYSAHIFNLFAFLWSVSFVIAFSQLSLAGAFAQYYWTLNKKEVSNSAMCTSVYNTVRYHLGSVAFGALIIATVRLIRLTIEYVQSKVEKYQNTCARAVLCACRCCFWILEKFLKFINKNAYIMIAVYGKNFCTSARMAVDLLFRNMIRVFIIDKVTDFLLLIGKLCVVGITGIVSFLLFAGKIPAIAPYLPELNYGFLPVFVIVFGSYVISSLFFNVYDIAVDTLFLCFLEDIERHDGSPEKPYYMSKELMRIIGKKNKFRED